MTSSSKTKIFPFFSNFLQVIGLFWREKPSFDPWMSISVCVRVYVWLCYCLRRSIFTKSNHPKLCPFGVFSFEVFSYSLSPALLSLLDLISSKVSIFQSKEEKTRQNVANRPQKTRKPKIRGIRTSVLAEKRSLFSSCLQRAFLLLHAHTHSIPARVSHR